MTWIETRGPHQDPAVGEAMARAMPLYPPEYAPAPRAERRWPDAVAADSIVLAHSLLPKALEHMFAGYAAMLDPALPLTRRQHEMLATLVSSTNRCFY